MNFARPLKAPFDLDTELPAALYTDETRPTISLVVRNPLGDILLVCPRKADEHANAYMFPQGAINRHETPRQAILRVLHQECAFAAAQLHLDQAQAIGVSPVDGDKQTKIHHVVFVSLRKQSQPMLNFENRSHLFASGPNFLWSKISGCRPAKRKMIVRSVFAAVQAELLRSDRWSPERFQNLLGYGTVT